MKQIHIYITIIVLLVFLISNASDKGTLSLLGEYSKQESEISAPTNFYLWCLQVHKISPQNFDSYSERFQVLDDGNTHFFQTYPGDWCYRNGTTEKYTRIEAFEESRFNPGSPWHEFEATYEIDTES